MYGRFRKCGIVFSYKKSVSWFIFKEADVVVSTFPSSKRSEVKLGGNLKFGNVETTPISHEKVNHH